MPSSKQQQGNEVGTNAERIAYDHGNITAGTLRLVDREGMLDAARVAYACAGLLLQPTWQPSVVRQVVDAEAPGKDQADGGGDDEAKEENEPAERPVKVQAAQATPTTAVARDAAGKQRCFETGDT